MISLYTNVWLFAVVWRLFRPNPKPWKWWKFILFFLPMALDGDTHMFSDLAEIGEGIRDTNQWLVVPATNSFPASFYAIGSFNSWSRLVSGLLAGLSIVWLVSPLSSSYKLYIKK